MSKEIYVPIEAGDTPQNYTEKMERAFKAINLDLHLNEVEFLEDDFKGMRRVLKIKNTKYHFT